jgi:hypothetical protein
MTNNQQGNTGLDWEYYTKRLKSVEGDAYKYAGFAMEFIPQAVARIRELDEKYQYLRTKIEDTSAYFENKVKEKEAEDKKAKDKAKDRAAKAAADEDEGDNAAEKKAVGEEIEDLVEAILEDEPTTDADEDEDDDDEERKKKKKEAEDAYMRSALKAIKPVIASMPKKYQDIAKDAVAKNFKRDTAGNSQTATILKSTNKSKKTVDAATIQAQAAEDIKNARQLWHEAQKSNQA